MDELIHGFYLVGGSSDPRYVHTAVMLLVSLRIAKVRTATPLAAMGLPEGNVDFREALAPHSAL